MHKIELLAPAKNLECGIAAIDHGADAVYIGAPRFGARAAAGNSLDDISQLCRYAHQFGAKVYVTVNTIIYDDELHSTQQLLNELSAIGADAVLVQDMGILSMNHGSMALHASTQTDNRTVEKVKWLRSLGFKRVVLARELSKDEINAIHQAVPDVELEVFVHGALCVSYSGVCYASHYCFKRSANRGECAQFCRLKFDLSDADGNIIEQGRHLLSLKDLCQIDVLEDLLEAGATSFKIEGRLKDVDYVKNVTAAYSIQLNKIISKNPEKYQRASSGVCRYSFEPDLKKTFNRGFTHYFLHGRRRDIFSPDTPKAIGEYVGNVKELRGGSFNVSGTASFANGDGLCFLNERRELDGFRVNRVVGNRLFPYKMPANLRPGMALYRNNDQEFERMMARKTAERKIPVRMTMAETDEGFALSSGNYTAKISIEKQMAQKPQRENIVRQLSKLGDTPYECADIQFVPVDFNFFIPSSKLAEMRRQLTEMMMKGHETDADNVPDPKPVDNESEPNAGERDSSPMPPVVIGEEYKKYPYLYNISNRRAAQFYRDMGMDRPVKAYECDAYVSSTHSPLLMQCRHCLKFSLGYCEKNGGVRSPWREPFYLSLSDGKRFRLEFRCRECQMNVYGM